MQRRGAGWLTLSLGALGALVLLACASTSALADPGHAISIFGEARYPADFTRFDYVDPEAPKGGTLRLPGFGSFDSLNGYIRKGRIAQGMSLVDAYTYDRLTVRAEDEPSTRYGLLAKTIELAPDRSWIEFVLREEARWHDGTPITADDVVWTFETLKTQGSPLLQVAYARVPRVEKRGPHTVRFSLADPTDRQLPLLVADLAVLPKHYWASREFARTTLEPPLGSGPYRVAQVESGRRIVYERVPDYWARALPVNVGRYNFDRIQIEYFLDTDVRLEAAKGGAVDHVVETVSKTWAQGYRFPARERGHFLLERIDTESPSAVRALLFNTRLDKFKDVRVRQALAYAYDREWTNHVQAHDAYLPADSYFAGSDYAQRGPPSEAERALLEPFRAQLPAQIFERAFAIPPTPGVGRNRENLRTAARLLREAGYVLKDGVLHDPAGQPLQLEILMESAARTRMTLHYADALRRLGVQIRMRVLDIAQFQSRRRALDYEMIYVTLVMRDVPGRDLRGFFHSSSAHNSASQNYAGVDSPVVDALVDRVIGARSLDDLRVASRALDRVLLHGYYMIDLGYTPGTQFAYWNRFGRPALRPRFATGFPHTWWFDTAKDARIRAGERIEAEAEVGADG